MGSSRHKRAPSRSRRSGASASDQKRRTNLSLFKKDIDELLDEFVEGQSTTFVDMKRVWLSRKFSFIHEAAPNTNLALFMQSLYAHTIGHMVSNNVSLLRRLGGLYCLYCLHETQPFKPPFGIYISLRELGKLKDLVVEAKDKGVKVASAVVKRMLEQNMFLYGSVDLNEASVAEKLNQLTELQDARVRRAYERLFADSRIEHFLHMDLGKEVDLDILEKMSTEYAEAKKRAIRGASNLVDVGNIKHISEDKDMMGERAEKLKEDWNAQKESFYQQTGINHPATGEETEKLAQISSRQDQEQHVEEPDDDGFHEIEQLLLQC